MPIWLKLLWELCGESPQTQITTLTTAPLSTEILQECLLTLEQVTTSLTVLAINASAYP